MTIKQLSIFVENRQGRMAEIAELVGNAGVDIRALSMADTSDFGILRLIVNKPDQAVDALRKAGIMVTLTDVVAVGVADQPGAFAKAVKAVSDAGISIEYMYAFISRHDNQAFVILRTDQPHQCADVLGKHGFFLPDSDFIYNL